MTTCGIYKIVNDLNGKCYVGQSLNIERRWEQHIYDALNRPETGTGIDVAMHKYGIENFHYEILEICSPDKLDDCEIYWIAELNTYYGEGYNRSIGGSSLRGENHPRAFLTEEQVWDIREMYNNHYKFKEVEEKYLKTGISQRGLQKIWQGENWPHVHSDVFTPENKRWHETSGVGHSEDQIGLSSDDRKLKQNEIDLMYTDYQAGMTFRQIAKKYHRDVGVVEKYMHNPKATSKVNLKGRQVKNLETQKVFSSISKAAKWAGCGATTITRHLYDGKAAGIVPDTEEPAHWQEI